MENDKTRDELISMSDEEIMCWVWNVPVGTTKFIPPTDPKEMKEFQYRWDKRFGVTLTRLGIQVKEPSKSGELIIDNYE